MTNEEQERKDEKIKMRKEVWKQKNEDGSILKKEWERMDEKEIKRKEGVRKDEKRK